MKRLLLFVPLLLILASCATVPTAPDAACPDNLVFLNGEELPGLLLGIEEGNARFMLLSGEVKTYPLTDILRIDLGQRVGDPHLNVLDDLQDEEVLSLIKRARLESVDPQKPVTVLLDEKVRRLENSDAMTGVWRRLIRINGQKGLRSANATFTYNPMYSTARVDFGYAISPEGRISILSTGSVRDKDLGDGREDGSQLRKIQIAVPDAVVGGFAYFQFSYVKKLDELTPFVAARTFAYTEPTKVIRTVIDVPENTDLNIAERNLAPLVTKSDHRENGRRIIVYEATALPELLSEPMMPTWRVVAPYFMVTTKTTWQTIAEAYRQVFNERMQPDETIAAQAENLIQGRSRQGALRALYLFVLRDVRDNGVDIWDRDPWPKPPAQTLVERRGNDVDRTALLMALAQAAGYKVSFCLLNYWDNHHPLEQAPYARHLSTPILRFEMPEGPIWSSLTNDDRIFGQLSSGQNGSFYLDVATGRTGATPRSNAKINHGRYQYNVQLQPDGSARILEEHQLFGYLAHSYRGFRHYEDERLRDDMIYDVRGFALRNQLVDFSIEGMNDLTDPIVFRRTSETPMFVVGSGGRYFILRLFDLGRGGIARVHDERLYPLERNNLYRVENTYRIHLPPGMTVRNLPAPATARSSWASYQASWRLEGNVLIFEDATEYTTTSMPAAGFEEYETFLRTRREVSEEVLIIERVEE